MFSPPQLKAMHFGLHSQLRGIYCSKEQVTLAHWSHSCWYARLALSFVSFWNTRTRPQSEQVFTFSARLSRIFGELFERARRRAPPLSRPSVCLRRGKPCFSTFLERTTLL